MQTFWEYGQRAAIAKLAGIDMSNLYAILARKRKVSLQRARLLQNVSGVVLGRPISWIDWVSNDTTTHLAFSPLKNR